MVLRISNRRPFHQRVMIVCIMSSVSAASLTFSIFIALAPHYAQNFAFSLAIAPFNVRLGAPRVVDCATALSYYAT
ncbi:hypothetical protein LSAT2_008890 [Lamellibrachia satsuma]|nr:hypothetical protein LSAT2_008890 [Lamellibrachia satsuma]